MIYTEHLGLDMCMTGHVHLGLDMYMHPELDMCI